MSGFNDQSKLPNRKRRFLVVAVALAGLLIAFLWETTWSWSSFEIDDSRIADAVTVRIDPERFPSGLTVEIEGHIDGQALVETHDDRVTTIGPGPVNETITGDYYSEEATIRFRPKDVSEGRLRFNYRFHYL